MTHTTPDNGPRPGGWAAAAPPQSGRPTGPALETPRLHLRLPDARDADAYIAFLGDPRSAMSGGIKESWEAWRAFAGVIGHWALRGFGMFTAELKDTGEPIGLIGNWMPESWPEPEIGWVLFAGKHEGKGLAFEAAKAVHSHVFTTLKWDTAVSYIDTGNTRSVALAQRLGATQDTTAATPRNQPCHVFRHHKGALA